MPRLAIAPVPEILRKYVRRPAFSGMGESGAPIPQLYSGAPLTQTYSLATGGLIQPEAPKAIVPDTAPSGGPIELFNPPPIVLHGDPPGVFPGETPIDVGTIAHVDVEAEHILPSLPSLNLQSVSFVDLAIGGLIGYYVFNKSLLGAAAGMATLAIIKGR